MPIEHLPTVLATLERMVCDWGHFTQETKQELIDDVRSARDHPVRAAGVASRIASMMDAKHAAALHFFRVEVLAAARQWGCLSEAIASARRSTEEAGEHGEDEMIDAAELHLAMLLGDEQSRTELLTRTAERGAGYASMLARTYLGLYALYAGDLDAALTWLARSAQVSAGSAGSVLSLRGCSQVLVGALRDAGFADDPRVRSHPKEPFRNE